MVRVNIIDVGKLSDQHLIAEYVEILMLVGSMKKDFDISRVPESYRLGEGHVNFFKDKLLYLKKRHERISREMKRRRFAVNKNLDIGGFERKFKNDWTPTEKDIRVIKNRLIETSRFAFAQSPDFSPRVSKSNLDGAQDTKNIVRNFCSWMHSRC